MSGKTSGSRIVGVVLTLNESANISKCLESMATLDDLIVIDSASTDQTVESAERAGAHVVVRRQTGPFNIAAQRNFALALPILRDGDWVFFLDADEQLTPQLADELRRTVADPSHGAFDLTPKYLFQGQWMKRSMGYPNWHPRLVRVGSNSFAGDVWEHFSTPDVGRIREPYLHFGNSKGFSDWLERHDRYSSWDAQTIVNYLDSKEPSAFRTTRRLRARRLAARMWLTRPLARFVGMYLFRRGFLDGRAAFKFAVRYAIYEYMTVEKIQELRRVRTGLPL